MVAFNLCSIQKAHQILMGLVGVKIFKISSFLFILCFPNLFSQDLMNGRVLPWSARIFTPREQPWLEQNLLEVFGPEGRALYSQAGDLKLRKKLRCGQNSSILETSLPSLGNKLITTRFRFDPVSKKMTLDVFVKEGENYRELLRSAYDVYHGPENYGRLREVSMLDVSNQNTTRMGMVNREILSFLGQVVGQSEQRVELNSPLGRDFFSLLSDNEQGFACCFNRLCREHIEQVAAPPPPVDTRRAEAASE